jgi:hypothetical protein
VNIVRSKLLPIAGFFLVGIQFAHRAETPALIVDSSHGPMLSKPEFMLDVIRAAAKSVKAAG